MSLEILSVVNLLNVITDVYGANSCVTRCRPKFHTEDSLLVSYRCLVGISASTLDIGIEDYRCFTQILQFNIGLLLGVGYDRFFPSPFL